MMDASPVILTNAITKSFRHVQALRGVSVRVDRGKITAVVGDNGSGKSTLIKIRVLLLDEPTASMGIQESHSALNILRSPFGNPWISAFGRSIRICLSMTAKTVLKMFSSAGNV